MGERKYRIAADVFDLFPGYVRGVVLAYQVHNGDSPADLVAMLREAEYSVRQQLSVENIAEHPRIKSWRDAYRTFGTKPSEFRSSIEAMSRRVLREQGLPSISKLVDIGNIVSLRHLLPIGGHAIDVVKHDLALRRAIGSETFVPFGSVVLEHPLAGEIIFVEDNTVLTRRWTWRQGTHTLVAPGTTDIEFNVDGLPPITQLEVEDISAELAALVQKFCHGEVRREVLNKNHPEISLEN